MTLLLPPREFLPASGCCLSRFCPASPWEGAGRGKPSSRLTWHFSLRPKPRRLALAPSPFLHRHRDPPGREFHRAGPTVLTGAGWLFSTLVHRDRGGGGEKDPGVKRPSLKRRGQGRTARNRTSPRRGGMEGGGPAAVTPRRGAGGQEAPPGSLFRAAPRLTTAARGALPAQRGPFPVEGLDGSSGPPPLVSTSSPTVEFLSAPTPYLTAGRQSDNLSPATAPWDL